MARLGVCDAEQHWLEGANFRVGARWSEDRWRLQVDHAGLRIRESADPDADGKELRNPVFQQCFSRLVDKGVGESLLVGQAAKRHFSGVVRVHDDQMTFEVAERSSIANADRNLRICWSLPAPFQVCESKTGLIVLAVGDAKELLRIEPLQTPDSTSPTASHTWDDSARLLTASAKGSDFSSDTLTLGLRLHFGVSRPQ